MAPSIGTVTDVVAVISMTITMPVTGARTVAEKKAAMPTIAQSTANAVNAVTMRSSYGARTASLM